MGNADILRNLENVDVIEVVPCLSDNYCYIIHCKKTQQTAVVDPGEANAVINVMEKRKLSLTHIFCTHHHHDHVDGNLELKEKYNCKVLANANDAGRIPGVDQQWQTGDQAMFGGYSYQVLATPGHTLGHVSLYFPGLEALFCGDTLFSCGCGRLFEGSFEQMYDSLYTIIMPLPDETKLYCGHEYTEHNIAFALKYEEDNPDLLEYQKYCRQLRQQNIPTMPTSLDIEKKVNPFLRCHTSQNLSERFQTTNPKEIFKKLRQARNRF